MPDLSIDNKYVYGCFILFALVVGGCGGAAFLWFILGG